MNLIQDRFQKILDGTESIRLCSAYILLNKNRVLLEKRSDVNWWGIPGGAINIGETPKQAAVREMMEETSCLIHEDQFVLFNIFSDIKDGRILQYPDNRIHLIDIAYVAHTDIKEEEIKLSDESLEFKYFSRNCIPAELIPPSQPIVNDLILCNLI